MWKSGGGGEYLQLSYDAVVKAVAMEGSRDTIFKKHRTNALCFFPSPANSPPYDPMPLERQDLLKGVVAANGGYVESQLPKPFTSAETFYADHLYTLIAIESPDATSFQAETYSFDNSPKNKKVRSTEYGHVRCKRGATPTQLARGGSQTRRSLSKIND
ncbi:uncharacterized protein BDR25DRAFT_354285 [Lindgomyces ingoldianus]|uniref:Uncharacterized protein n=1 Tax=Lindgomyces ingoldianus TaxID=673940 RepID=A0ACB6R012_9PLEO|nr:uncharacterized protein BDR25DRAFT_354285 [Lindgomyces ingoldianus]KAF2471786.1 hypothetical protein BDR25DRAFT_354285 [Lindgomyces ingoldianus]